MGVLSSVWDMCKDKAPSPVSLCLRQVSTLRPTHRHIKKHSIKQYHLVKGEVTWMHKKE